MTGGGQTSGIDFVIAKAQDVLDRAAARGGAGALLSRTELDAADRFRNPADGRRYAGAHVLFRLMAARALGIDPAKAAGLAVHRECRSCGGPHGKPMIDGTSLSLSKAGGTVMVAAGLPGHPLGADLEAVPRELHAGFDGYALSPGERRTLENSDVESRIRLWVAKEAALKVNGHGLAVDPWTLHLLPAPLDPWAPAGWATTVESPGRGGLHGLDIAWVPAPPGFAAAIASATQPVIHRLDVSDPSLT